MAIPIEGTDPVQYKFLTENSPVGVVDSDGNPIIGYKVNIFTEEQLLTMRDGLSSQLDLINSRLAEIQTSKPSV